MKCRHCFYVDVANNREVASYGLMSDETLEALVRRALIFADETCSFAFQGGDPTLIGLEFYQKLLNLQARYNTRNIVISNAIQTNAYAMTETMAQFFSDNHFLVGVSLDGTRETHNALRIDIRNEGSYDAVVAGIEKLKAANVNFNILCVVSQVVARQPVEVFNALAPYGFIQFVACIDDFSNKKKWYSLESDVYDEFLIKTFDLYYDSYRKGHFVSIRMFDNYIRALLRQPSDLCSVAQDCGSYFVVESDGSVYPCDFYVLDQWKMGNITRNSFYFLNKSEAATSFRILQVPSKCKRCKWFFVCRGGCKRDQFTKDSGEVKNKWCKSYQKFFEHSYEKLKRMAEQIARTPEKAVVLNY